MLHPFYSSHHLHPSSNRHYALPLERLVELKWACSSYCSTSFQSGHTLLRFPERQTTRKPVGMCCLLAPGRLQNCTRCKNNSNSISSCPKNRTNHKAHNCAGMFVHNATGGFTERRKKTFTNKGLNPSAFHFTACLGRLRRLYAGIFQFRMNTTGHVHRRTGFTLNTVRQRKLPGLTDKGLTDRFWSVSVSWHAFNYNLWVKLTPRPILKKKERWVWLEHGGFSSAHDNPELCKILHIKGHLLQIKKRKIRVLSCWIIPFCTQSICTHSLHFSPSTSLFLKAKHHSSALSLAEMCTLPTDDLLTWLCCISARPKLPAKRSSIFAACVTLFHQSLHSFSMRSAGESPHPILTTCRSISLRLVLTLLLL